MGFKNRDDQEIRTYLDEAKTIAVVGLSNKEDRTSYKIANYLQEKGYKIFPVNPMLAGQTILGEPVFSELSEINEPIDIVDVFRRSEFLPGIAQEFLASNAKVFWAQLGIESEEAAQILLDGGQDKIVMDRCVKIELEK